LTSRDVGDLALLRLFICLERALFRREAMALEDQVGQIASLFVQGYFGIVGIAATTIALVKWFQGKLK